MDTHFAEERTIIPACQDIGVAVPQKETRARTGAFIWQPCVLVAFQKSRDGGFTYQARSYLKGLQRHEAVDKLRGRIRSLAVCQSAAKGLNFSSGTGSAKTVSDDLETFVVRAAEVD